MKAAGLSGGTLGAVLALVKVCAGTKTMQICVNTAFVEFQDGAAAIRGLASTGAFAVTQKGNSELFILGAVGMPTAGLKKKPATIFRWSNLPKMFEN